MTSQWANWLKDYNTDIYTLSRKEGWCTFVDQAARPRFAVLPRAEMARLSDEELEDYTDARMVWNANLPTVRTHQLDATHRTIDEVMASNHRDASSLRGTAVIDDLPGLGKTVAATRYGRSFHRKVVRREGPTTEDGHERLPVAFISLTAGMTLKNLNEKILEFYWHPAERTRTRAQLGSLAVDCVLSCATRLIILDDLHFVNFRHKDGAEVSNHLKWLSNEMPVTFVYVGVGLSEANFFNEGRQGQDAAFAQTSRRSTRSRMVPFNIASDNGFRAWVDLLRVFEEYIMLADSTPGMLTSNAKLLHKRTQGHIASLTNLLDRACYRAISDGSETLKAGQLATIPIDYAASQRESS